MVDGRGGGVIVSYHDRVLSGRVCVYDCMSVYELWLTAVVVVVVVVVYELW